MRGAASAIALSCLFLLNGCGDNEPSLARVAGPTAKVARFEFALDGMRYAISLPEQAGMREQRDSNSIVFDARKGQRQQKVMQISATPQRPLQTLDRQRRIGASGRVVRFRETSDAGGGSGGAMATIEGRFELGPVTLFLYCSDQGESALFPDWCLDHLDSLQLMPASSGNG